VRFRGASRVTRTEAFCSRADIVTASQKLNTNCERERSFGVGQHNREKSADCAAAAQRATAARAGRRQGSECQLKAISALSAVSYLATFPSLFLYGIPPETQLMMRRKE